MIFVLLVEESYVVLFVFQVHDIEFTQIEIQVVQGLKSGNEALHKLHTVWIQQIHYKTDCNEIFYATNE